MNMKKCIYLVLSLVLLAPSFIFAAQKGSDTAVSVEDFFEFPAADNDNEVKAFGCFKDGFSLEDATTTLTFSSIFPVGGNISLNGGSLFLKSDLITTNTCSICTGGYIYGFNRSVIFASSVASLCGQSYDATFEEANVFMNSDIALLGTVHFKGGNCMLVGNNNNLNLSGGSEIVLDSGTTLTIKDMRINDIMGNKIRCEDDTCTIVLDNVTWSQSGNFTLTQGSIMVMNDCLFMGPHSFVYESSQSSTIKRQSNMILDAGFTFSYDSAAEVDNLLCFADETAVMTLDGATLATTATGLKLTKGKMVVKKLSFITSDPLEYLYTTNTKDVITRGKVHNRGVSFGNNNVDDNFTVAIEDGARLWVSSGRLVYRNTVPALCAVGNAKSLLFIDSNAMLYVSESLDIGKGFICFEDGSTLKRSAGKSLMGSVLVHGELNYIPKM